MRRFDFAGDVVDALDDIVDGRGAVGRGIGDDAVGFILHLLQEVVDGILVRG